MGLGENIGIDINGNLLEDINSDKICGVTLSKNPENFKNLEKRESEACGSK
jgi:hypothetical protein